MIDVDAQDLAEERGSLLAVSLRIARGAAVAGPDPEHAVRTERDLTAVVVGVGLIDAEDLLEAVGVGAGPVG